MATNTSAKQREHFKRDITTTSHMFDLTRVIKPQENILTKKDIIFDMLGLLIERVRSRNPTTLNIREQFYINKLDTFEHWLNRE